MSQPISQSILKLSQITTIKHQLITTTYIIYVGYSLQSLKNNQLLYQTYDLFTYFKVQSGKFNVFGINFLTPYVAYKDQGFINLISMSGRKVIQLTHFHKSAKTQLIKSIDYKDYQLRCSTEKYGLFYSDQIITLVQFTQSSPFLNILIRTYNINSFQSNSFRIISFDKIPLYEFYNSNLYIFNQSQITVFDKNLQPEYYEFYNYQCIVVRAVHEELIITFKNNDRDYFYMNLDGRIVQLQQNVISIIIQQNLIFLIVERSYRKKQLLQMRYDKIKKRYIKNYSINLPIQVNINLLANYWMKINYENEDKYLKIEKNMDQLVDCI